MAPRSNRTAPPARRRVRKVGGSPTFCLWMASESEERSGGDDVIARRRICDLLEALRSAELGYELVGVELGPSGGAFDPAGVHRPRRGHFRRGLRAREPAGRCDPRRRGSDSGVVRARGLLSGTRSAAPRRGPLRPVRRMHVRLRTREPIDGRRGWTGRLVGCREGSVVVREGDEDRSIPFDLVGKANLVPEV